MSFHEKTYQGDDKDNHKIRVGHEENFEPTTISPAQIPLQSSTTSKLRRLQKEDVVLQMNMLVEIILELIELLVG